MDLYNLVVSAKLTKGEGGGGYPEPEGTVSITENGVHNVKDYASANVSVPIPSGYIIPSGTKSITENGVFDVTDFASASINVPTGGGGDTDAEDDIITRTISGSYYNSRVSVVGTNAFAYCTKLTAVSLDNATSIGTSAFATCSSLETVRFSNATVIGNYAFQACSRLTTAIFPTASSVGNSVFYGCTHLMSIYFLSTSVASIKSTAFTNTPMGTSSYTGSFGSIFVPASLVDTYKNKTNWSYFSDRITAYAEE